MARDGRQLAASHEAESDQLDRRSGNTTRTEATNPFYMLLVFFSILFTLAAFLYLATDLAADDRARPGLSQFMARHGTAVLLILGGCIVLTSLASMALDSYRWRGTKRIAKRRGHNEGC